MISDKFLHNTKDRTPNRILVEAYPHIQNVGFALDLGCGAFRDTRFLLEKGFFVDAVDNSPNVQAFAPNDSKMHFHLKSFDDFEYIDNKYDLVHAHYALPFCHPEKFAEVWTKIVNSLKSAGVFAGQFFGPEDSFAPNKEMTFLDRASVTNLFVDFEIYTFVEAKRTSKNAVGNDKFWHVFDVIAAKK